MAAIGPHSRASRIANGDGRTREMRLKRETVESMLAHLGGNASAAQRIVIDRIAGARLRVALLDRKLAETGAFSELDAKTYIGLTNCIVRDLRLLGLKGADKQPPSMADYLAAKAASGASVSAEAA